MYQNEELEELYKTTTSFFESSTYVEPELYVLIDGYMITSLGSQIDIYNDFEKIFKDYFSSQHIQTKFIPPLGGRGGTGGGILAFLLTHAEFLISIIRSIPIILRFAKTIRNYHEKKSTIRLQKIFNNHKTSIPVTLHIISSAEYYYQESMINRKSIINLILHVNELNKRFSKSFPTFNFVYTLESEIRNSLINLAVDFKSEDLNDKFISKIFKTIDSKYIDDNTNIHLSFSTKNGRFKKSTFKL